MRFRPPASKSTLWLQLLLVGTVASVALLAVQGYRTARSNRDLAARALREYGAFAAWTYRERLVSALRAASDEVLGPVNHGDQPHLSLDHPSVQDLGHLLPWEERCDCHLLAHGPLPSMLYAFVLGADTLGIASNQAPTGGDFLGDPELHPNRTSTPTAAITADDARWVHGILTDLGRASHSASHPYPIHVAARGDSVRMLVARAMPAAWGDTLVYAFEYTPQAMDTFFRNVLTRSELLPPSLVNGRANSELIDLAVHFEPEGTLFASRDVADWEPEGSNELLNAFDGLQVRAQLRPELGASLLIGGAPSSRVPGLLVMLLLALGLTAAAAIQLRRDVRFASDRAQFVANVSHELRTPLAQVRLVIDTIRLGRDTDATVREQALELADREVLRLQHLVEGLLRFTRGTRQSDGPRAPLDLAEEARVAVHEFAPLASPRGISITVSGAETVPINMRQGAARQLLLNLLDNATKYGGDHAPVTVSVTRDADGAVLLAVEDTGPGVPETERKRIWEAFERGTQAETRATGGSGIGLTIVRDIATEHGGEAYVETANTGGARFVVRMPSGDA